jgi:hypothetical protein
MRLLLTSNITYTLKDVVVFFSVSFREVFEKVPLKADV